MQFVFEWVGICLFLLAVPMYFFKHCWRINSFSCSENLIWWASLPATVCSWESKVPPPKLPPPINKALLRAYQPLVSLHKALWGPYFLGGGGGSFGGSTLGSHDMSFYLHNSQSQSASQNHHETNLGANLGPNAIKLISSFLVETKFDIPLICLLQSQSKRLLWMLLWWKCHQCKTIPQQGFSTNFKHQLFNIEVLNICAMVKSRYIGDGHHGHPTFNRNPYFMGI